MSDILSADRVGELLAQQEAADEYGLGDTTAFALLRSHEALRAERDVAQSIAERYMGGWEDVVPDENGSEHQWVLEWWVETEDGVPVTGKRQDVEPMTPEQVEWFRAREHRR